MTNIVKQVEFMGDILLGLKNPENNKVYVGVAWVCQGLGFTKNQADTQTKKIQADPVLSKGASKIPLNTNGIVNNILFLEITYLPLWLAKINANIVKPEIQSKLIEYQLRAKDILAEAFVPQFTSQFNTIPQTYQEALRALADSHDTIATQRPKVHAFDNFIAAKGNQTISQAAKALGTGRDRLFAWLRCHGILMSNNEPYQVYVDKGYFDVVEGVNRGWVRGRTLITPKGISWVDAMINPLETMEDFDRIIASF